MGYSVSSLVGHIRCPLPPLPAGRLPLEGRVERPCALTRGSVPSHNGCSILLYGGGRITQLQYLLLKYSQFLGANFREIVIGEVRILGILGSPFAGS